MRHRRLAGISLMAGVLAGATAPGVAIADDVTLNVPVRLTRMAANVTRGLVSCDVKGEWSTDAPRGSQAPGSDNVQRSPLRATGTANFTIPASGDFNASVSVRVATTPPPRAWIDSGNAITLKSTYYFCRIQVATADSAWQPQLQVVETPSPSGVPRISTQVGANPPAWANPADARSLVVSGPLNVTTPR